MKKMENQKAEGSVELGNEPMMHNYAMCHGDFGSGGKGYPCFSRWDKRIKKIQRLNPADENPNPDTPIENNWFILAIC